MLLRARGGAAACLIAAILALVGCQSGGNNQFPAKVSGKVTYNGALVTGGTITFHGGDGTPYEEAITPEGTYKFVNLPEGTMTVTIETESFNPNKKQEAYRSGGGGQAAMYAKSGGGGGGRVDKSAPKGGAPKSPYLGEPSGGPVYVKIPDKYRDKAKSGLSVTLKKGDQTQNFELTD
jgi:hypothetical protein